MAKRKRDYRREYLMYKSKPEQKKKAVARRRARRRAIKKYGKAALKGKDVHHKDYNPHNDSPNNLTIISSSKNRSKNRGRGGRPKGAKDRRPRTRRSSK